MGVIVCRPNWSGQCSAVIALWAFEHFVAFVQVAQAASIGILMALRSWANGRQRWRTEGEGVEGQIDRMTVRSGSWKIWKYLIRERKIVGKKGNFRLRMKAKQPILAAWMYTKVCVALCVYIRVFVCVCVCVGVTQKHQPLGLSKLDSESILKAKNDLESP